MALPATGAQGRPPAQEAGTSPGYGPTAGYGPSPGQGGTLGQEGTDSGRALRLRAFPGGRPAMRPARRERPNRAAPHPARRALRLVGPPLAVTAVALGLWQWLATLAHVRPQILPTPWLVVSQGWQWRSVIWANTLPTLEETFAGFGASLVCATALAVAMRLVPACRRAIYPFLVVSQTLPLIAIAPIVDLWLGFGLVPKLVVVAIVTFFPVTVGLMEGFDSTDPDAVNLLRSMGAGRLAVFRRLELPGAMPYFFAGLRIAITYAVVGAIFAEYVGASSGLGIFMSEQANQFRTDLVYAAVAVTALVSVALFGLTWLVQRVAIPWYGRSRRARH